MDYLAALSSSFLLVNVFSIAPSRLRFVDIDQQLLRNGLAGKRMDRHLTPRRFTAEPLITIVWPMPSRISMTARVMIGQYRKRQR